MEKRTDLAMEAREIYEETNRGKLSGVTVEHEAGGVPATIVSIRSAAGARALGKPKGTYITVELGPMLRREKESFQKAAEAISGYLQRLLKLGASMPVLLVGLGNRDVTPDAVGPLTAAHVLVTRHMVQEMPRQFGTFRPVSAVVPGVLGTTGVESAELVRGTVERVRPAAVIAVDAIVSRSTQRLCSTVQLSDTGIVPGSGIHNSRSAFDQRSLGVPVIAVGVPTVTDAATMAADLMERAGQDPDLQKLRQVEPGMIVTTGDIDRKTREIARVLAFSINLALQPGLSLQDVEDLAF